MLSKIKPLTIPRIGLGLVFLWFGIEKFTNPDIWLGLVPNFILNFFPTPKIFINLQGILESLIGLALILGKQIKLASVLSALMLISIIFILGYSPISVRDFGLLTIAIALIIKSFKE